MHAKEPLALESFEAPQRIPLQRYFVQGRIAKPRHIGFATHCTKSSTTSLYLTRQAKALSDSQRRQPTANHPASICRVHRRTSCGAVVAASYTG